MGVTLAIFIRVGNSPVSKHKFISSDSHIEKNSLNDLSKNVGIPKGPADLNTSNRSMIFAISSGPVAVRKNEHPFGFIISLPLPDSPLAFGHVF